MRLLFVCTGNTCRSPMAGALARRAAGELGWDELEISSAGLSAMAGERASKGARRAMEACCISLDAHRSRKLTPEIIAQADLILTMTQAHAAAVKRIAPGARVYALHDYVGETGDVPDPYGAPEAVYLQCARRLQPRIVRALERLWREERGVRPAKPSALTRDAAREQAGAAEVSPEEGAP